MNYYVGKFRVKLLLLVLLLINFTSCCQATTRSWRPLLRRLISGGSNASFQTFPYVCSIRYRHTGRHFCGGVLLGSRSVLTAAYCVSPTVFNVNPEVWCGDIKDINSSIGAVDVLGAVKTTTHECYDPKSYFDDIAVLELNASVVHGKPIENIIGVAEFQNLKPGDQLIGLGWGQTGGGGGEATHPKILQQALLPFISQEDCNSPGRYNNTVDWGSMFCAGYFNGTADTCAGDSGGPMVFRVQQNEQSSSGSGSSGSDDVLVGLVSWGSGYASKGFPGVYARVDIHRDWIVLHSHCACSSRNSTTSGGNSGEINRHQQQHQNGGECILLKDSGELTKIEHKADTTATGSTPISGPAFPLQPPALCYVIDFEKCPLATASKVYPGRGWLPCRKTSQGKIETVHSATSCSFRAAAP